MKNQQKLIYPKIILDLEKKYNLLINKRISGNSKELKEYKNLLPSLTNFQKEALIGLTLGDINLQKLSKNGDYRIRFEYGKINEEYALHLYQLFKHWILSPPKSMERIMRIKRESNNNRRGKLALPRPAELGSPIKESILKTLRFQTITHESFNFLGELFIKDKNKKSVPSNLIKDHLTEVGLSYWFMDDGGKLDYSKNEGKGLVFNTQNFSLWEVENMTKELKKKFGFSKCWVGVNKNKPIIKISGNDYEKILGLMIPYIVPSMLRKLPSSRKK